MQILVNYDHIAKQLANLHFYPEEEREERAYEVIEPEVAKHHAALLDENRQLRNDLVLARDRRTRGEWLAKYSKEAYEACKRYADALEQALETPSIDELAVQALREHHIYLFRLDDRTTFEAGYFGKGKHFSRDPAEAILAAREEACAANTKP